mgnify:CR=1 FL=1
MYVQLDVQMDVHLDVQLKVQLDVKTNVWRRQDYGSAIKYTQPQLRKRKKKEAYYSETPLMTGSVHPSFLVCLGFVVHLMLKSIFKINI